MVQARARPGGSPSLISSCPHSCSRWAHRRRSHFAGAWQRRASAGPSCMPCVATACCFSSAPSGSSPCGARATGKSCRCSGSRAPSPSRSSSSRLPGARRQPSPLSAGSRPCGRHPARGDPHRGLRPRRVPAGPLVEGTCGGGGPRGGCVPRGRPRAGPAHPDGQAPAFDELPHRHLRRFRASALALAALTPLDALLDGRLPPLGALGRNPLLAYIIGGILTLVLWLWVPADIPAAWAWALSLGVLAVVTAVGLVLDWKRIWIRL